VSGARRCHSMSPIVHSLHWLPIRQRVTFKIALLVWKCVHGAAPPYLQELGVLVEDDRGRPRLRSASTRCIQLPTVSGEYANGTAKFCVPWFVNLEHLSSTLCDSSLSLGAFKGRIASATDNDEHHLTLFGRFNDRGAVYKCSDLLTYLLTHWDISINISAN